MIEDDLELAEILSRIP